MLFIRIRGKAWETPLTLPLKQKFCTGISLDIQVNTTLTLEGLPINYSYILVRYLRKVRSNRIVALNMLLYIQVDNFFAYHWIIDTWVCPISNIFRALGMTTTAKIMLLE